MTVDDFEMQC